METENKIQEVLGSLIERCKDGQKGYFTAAEDVTDPELKTLFKSYSLQRDAMITELQQELHKFGKLNDESSSLEGTLHRAWIDLTSALLSKDRHRILSECERGEDYAVSAYQQALKADLPANLRQLLEQQYQQIKQAHDQIRSLRDASK